MHDHDFRAAIDALCARLVADVQTQAAQWTNRYAEDRDTALRECEAQWIEKIDAVRLEWQGRLQAGLADAAADADRRVAAEAERAYREVESLTKAAAEAVERHRAEIDAVREEWHGRLQAGLAEAAAESERRIAAEADRVRREAEGAAAESTDRVRDDLRHDMERAASESADQLRTEFELAAAATTRVRAELEQTAAETTARLRDEMERALAAERSRAEGEIEAERTRAQAELAAERTRLTSDLETERLSTQALALALEEAEAAASREHADALRLAAAQATPTDPPAVHAFDAPVVIAAREAERQAQLAVVDRLLGAMHAIDAARSLTDTLSALATAAASVAPRAALFIVKGSELRGWKAVGFGDDASTMLRLSEDDAVPGGLLALAASTTRAVSTTTVPAPLFAGLPSDRAGLAVPVTVGGHSVAVLYADDGSLAEPEAPASWPEAVQVLAAHASACLTQITAVRTVQAMQQMPTAAAQSGAAGRAASAMSGSEEDSSARRYARLLVSEIKLYNEAAVRTGREKRDLLNRLAPEIERARRLYEERVSAHVGARATFFQHELVHTLADGDSALLGGAA